MGRSVAVLVDFVQGGEEILQAGGTTSGVTVDDGGAEFVGFIFGVSGGTAIGTELLSGGTEGVESGGTALGTQNFGGQQIIVDGGVASGTLVTIENVGGVITDGLEILSTGGTAVSTTISAGGSEINSGGITTGTMVASGGIEFVISGGTASSTTVSGGGTQLVGSGGTASRTTIDSGGTAIVSGGTISGVTLAAGGTALVSGGTLEILSGEIVSGVTVYSNGDEMVDLGGSARGTVVSSGGTASVESGGSASGTIVSAGGVQIVSSGGSASDALMIGSATISGGTLELLNGASGGGPIFFAGSGGTLKIDGPGNDTVSGGAGSGPNTIDYTNLSTLGLVAIIAGVNGTVNKGNGNDTLHGVQKIVDDGTGRTNGDVFEVFSGETVIANPANFNYLIELSPNLSLTYGTTFTGITELVSNVGTNIVNFAPDSNFAYLYGSTGNDTLTLGSGGGYMFGEGGTNVRPAVPAPPTSWLGVPAAATR